MKYESIAPENFDMNAFNEIGKRWMLIGAYDKDKDAPRRYNAMTGKLGKYRRYVGKAGVLVLRETAEIHA